MSRRAGCGTAPRWASCLGACAILLGVAVVAAAAPPTVGLSVIPRIARPGEVVRVTVEVRGEDLTGPADGYLLVNDSFGRFLILPPAGEDLGHEAIPALAVAPGQHLVRQFRVRVPRDAVPSRYGWRLVLVRAGSDPNAEANRLGGATAYGRVDEAPDGWLPRAAGWTLGLAAGLTALLAIAMRRGWEHPSVCLGYGVLAILLTYPLAGHLTDAVPGMMGSDAYVFLWNHWWIRRALLEEWTSPFFTRAIYAPEGVGLAFHTLAPLNGILALPFQLAGGIPLASNLIQLGAFVLSGWGTYFLARALGCDRPAAFVAGLIFAGSPFRSGHLMGHYNLTSTQWLPLALAFEVRALRGGGAWRREAVLAGACLAAMAWTDLQYLVFGVLLAAVVGLAGGGEMRDGRIRGRALGTMAGTLIVGAAPLVGPAFRDLLAGSAAAPGVWESGAAVYKMDLVSFLLPSVFHPFFGDWALGLVERLGLTLETTAYLGLIPLLLAAAALVRLRHDRVARWWGGIGLGALVLSLGPFPSIAGAAVPAVPLPYRLLAAVPVLNNLRTPSRFAVCLVLAVAILAGRALTRWERARDHRGWGRHGALGLLAGLILFEYLAVPTPLTSAAVPEAYRQIAQDRRDGVVLEVPLGRKGGFSAAGWLWPAQMYWQAAHGKPMLGGYVSRVATRRNLALREEPILASLLDLQAGADLSPARVQQDRERAPELIARLNLRWVLVHPPFYHGKVEAYLREVLPLEPLADTEGIAVYRVRRKQAKDRPPSREPARHG